MLQHKIRNWEAKNTTTGTTHLDKSSIVQDITGPTLNIKFAGMFHHFCSIPKKRKEFFAPNLSLSSKKMQSHAEPQVPKCTQHPFLRLQKFSCTFRFSQTLLRQVHVHPTCEDVGHVPPGAGWDLPGWPMYIHVYKYNMITIIQFYSGLYICFVVFIFIFLGTLKKNYAAVLQNHGPPNNALKQPVNSCPFRFHHPNARFPILTSPIPHARGPNHYIIWRQCHCIAAPLHNIQPSWGTVVPKIVLPKNWLVIAPLLRSVEPH